MDTCLQYSHSRHTCTAPSRLDLSDFYPYMKGVTLNNLIYKTVAGGNMFDRWTNICFMTFCSRNSDVKRKKKFHFANWFSRSKSRTWRSVPRNLGLQDQGQQPNSPLAKSNVNSQSRSNKIPVIKLMLTRVAVNKRSKHRPSRKLTRHTYLVTVEQGFWQSR